MKKSSVIQLLLIVTIIGCSQKKQTKDNATKSDSTKIVSSDSIVASPGDRIFRIGDFLFEGPKNMKFEFVKYGTQPKTKTKSDTLYTDKAVVLLGDISEVKSPGIYKKFKFKSKFENFKVDQIYKGTLAKPNFSKDPDAKMFITNIREGCESLGVNFAGHFTIIEWGCGTSCQQIAIVDRINGDILFSKIPFDTLDGHCGIDYRKDSRMIIINTVALDGVEGYVSNFGRKPCIYEIKNKELSRVE